MPSPASSFSPPPPPQWPEPERTPPFVPRQAPSLYPLTIGRTVSLAISLYRFGWRTFTAISLVATIPLVAVNALVTAATFQVMSDWQQSLMRDLDILAPTTTTPPTDVLATFPWQAFALTFSVALLVGPITFLGNAALIKATSQVVSGAKLSFGVAFRAALARIGGLIALYLVVTAISLALSIVLAFGPVVAVLVPGALGGGGPLAFVVLVIGVAVVFLSVFLLLRLFFAIEVLMLEDASVGTALRRSYDLVAGSMWRVAGYTIVFAIVLGLIGLGVGVVAFFVAALMAPQELTSPTALVDMNVILVQDITSGLLAALFAPITSIGMVLLYLDLRWRHGERVPQPGGAEAQRRPTG